MDGNISAIIMAAGEGTGMKSKTPKVLHQVCGSSILDYVVKAAKYITDTPPIVIIGQDSEAIIEHLGETCRFVHQNGQLGTGDAMVMAAPYLESYFEYVVVLSGETPLIQGSTLHKMLQYTKEEGFHGVVLSSEISDSDASIYCFETQSLLDALKKLKDNNALGGYYMTDILSILEAEGKSIGVYKIDDYREIMGINTRVQLAEAERLMRQRINESHMLAGVTIIDSASTYIGPDVKIGEDTVIYPGNNLEGKTIIEDDCILYPNNRLVDAYIGRSVKLQASVILDSKVGSDTVVGPYAYIRPGSTISDHVRIGDFVEVKNSTIGHGTKVSHLTYIGDAELGEGINVGCGVVCVNYDGKKKHKTIIGDNAFIGCNVNLVAPIEVEKNAYIAAGSTITEKVPSKALAIARARQVNKEGWVDKRTK